MQVATKKASTVKKVSLKSSGHVKKLACPVTATIKKIGGKWKCIILWQLSAHTLRFNQLEKNIPGISQKVLAQQLRELEKDKLVRRKVFPQIPPKVEYSLTPQGKSLHEIIDAMSAWGTSRS